MSHATRPTPIPGSTARTERKSRLRGWLIWTGGLLTVVAVLFAVTRFTATASYTPLYQGGPRAQLSQTTFDYGNVKNNTRVETTFSIQNVGDRQLYFRQEPVVAVLEGCCPPTASIDRSELDPGESANVTLSFSMHEGMDGPHDFRVKVRTNDVEQPEQEVAILSNWVP